MTVLRALLFFWLGVVAALAGAEERAALVLADEVRFTPLKEGFRIEIDVLAPVSVATAWRVLTDFANMPRFVPNLTSSRVLSSQNNLLRIEQRGQANFGPFSHVFASVREIEILPMREILARQISGTAQRMESRMRLTPLEDGTTRLEYRAEIVPDTPLPPLIGPAFIRHETAEQFSAVIREMLKRQAAPPSKPAG